MAKETKDRVFSVPEKGGDISTVYREEAIKDCTSNGLFDRETVEAALDSDTPAFSDNFYYSADRKNLAKWEKSASGAVSLKELKKQFPDDILDMYHTEDNAKHAFMLGDETAMSRVMIPQEIDANYIPEKMAKTEKPSAVWYKMKADDPSSIVTVTDNAVIKAVGDRYTEKTRDKFLKAGTLMSSVDDKFRFAKDKEALVADYEKRSAVETGAGFTVDEVETEAPEPEVKKDAIAPVAPSSLELPPLTDREVARLAKLEGYIEKAKDAYDSAPMVMGAALEEVRAKQLFRETRKADGELCKTYGEYAEFKFGITREYAQNLAQISGYMDIANEAIEGGDKLNVSVATANAMLRDTNKIAKSLGLGRVEFETLKPMIVASTALLIDTAPKDEEGNPVISPRFVDAFNEKIRDHLHGGVVEIEGKQMTLAAAKEKGLLNASLVEEVTTAAAEGIRINRATIMSETQDAWERQNEPVTNGGDGGAKPTEYYRGEVPELDVHCEKHGETKIISIGNGRFQTKCQCRWHVSAEDGELVCFEVKGRRVKV